MTMPIQVLPPEVSVIIPVYNGAAYIAEAINSVLMQTNVRFEIVVGDNGSSDNTLAIVRSFIDERIVLLEGKSNAGIYGNLQRLFALARAPLVKILCADDWILPGGLRGQVSFMQTNHELAFSRCWGTGDAKLYATNAKLKHELGLPGKLYPPDGLLAFAVFGCIAGNLSRTIVRPSVVGSDLKFDLTLPYAGDYEFWARLAHHHPFGMQNEEWVFVRAHEMQSTRLLNMNNELTLQTNELLERFSKSVDPKLLSLLRWHWAINFVSQQWHKSFECLRAGSWAGFRVGFRRRRYTFNNFVTLLIYFVSINGRLGRSFTTSRLKAELISRHSNNPPAHQ